MHILITGGTGFIGSALGAHLHEEGHEITVLTRQKGLVSRERYRYITALEDLGFDAIVNLAGMNLNEKRWNSEVKEEIRNSRIEFTKNLVKFIESMREKPKVFLSGSAIGYYGADPEKVFEEDSKPLGRTFSRELCEGWEKEAQKVNGVRVLIVRTGIVLQKNGGALKEMLPSFKYGFGAQLGEGTQWMSWIHLKDHVRAMVFLLKSELDGVFNLTAPKPVSNAEFSIALGAALNRPVFLKMPHFVVRTLFGEMAEELLLTGANVIPRRLVDAGFQFEFPKISQAFQDIFK